ncbi:DUF6541 family protein [Microbacterium sp. NPDC055903]
MILDWLAQAPVLIVAIAVVFVPGVLALWGVGIRGLALIGLAPVFGVAVVGVSALLLGILGIAWSPVSWAVAAFVLIVLAWVLGLVLGRRLDAHEASGRRWILVVALVIGVLFGLWRLTAYISDPSGISQTNDAVFHMNAVRYAIETADASSLHVNSVIGGRSFYPAAWHGIVSLIVMVTGTSIPIAANMLTLVIGALIWTLGVAWLTLRITDSRAVAGYAAVLSSALQAFPLLMFQWGVLFPNALSTALVPAGVAVVMSIPRWSRAGEPWRSGVRGGLLVMVVAGALLLSQPAAFLPWAAISMVWLSYRLIWSPQRLNRRAGVTVVIAAWIMLAVIWLYLAQGTSGSHWRPFRSWPAGLLDVLLNGHVMIPYAWGVSGLMILGLIVAVRHGQLRWFVVAWAGIAGLYLLAACAGRDIFRVGILGAWYADPYRIAALAPIVVIPLAAIGIDAIVRAITARMKRMGSDAARQGTMVVAALIATALFMVVLVATRGVAMPAVTEGSFDRDSRYVLLADTYLNPDERALLESLDEYVQPGERVIGNPSTGSGFGYFLSGVDVYPRTWSPPKTEAWDVIADRLRDAATDPSVCAALEVYHDPEFVVDFGLGETGAGRYQMPGMTGFQGHQGFELVAERGEASLWRITACDQ